MPFTEKYIRPLAVAVVRYQGKILAVRGVDHVKNEVFFRLPGGGIEFGETAEAALKREFAEEFGVEVKIGRRLDVTENVFSYEGRAGHEIVFCFRGFFARRKIMFPGRTAFCRTGNGRKVCRMDNGCAGCFGLSGSRPANQILN